MKYARPGFTLIEVIIAMAIAAVMVMAVQSATQSMTRTAQKQMERSAEEARFQRFVEIFRRDVQGWIIVQDAAASAGSVETDKDRVLLQFATTADSLSTAISMTPSQSSAPRSVSGLRYLLRQRDTQFEIIRAEYRAGTLASEFTVWKGSVEPRIEFLQADLWVPEWKIKVRPQCVRVTAGAKRVVFSL